MNYQIQYTGIFKRDYKRIKKRGYDLMRLEKIIAVLLKDGCLPEGYHPHKLVSNYKGYWECHIQPDWLLVWKLVKDTRTIILTRTGTHADLFR